jgi:hypothetical protein
LILGVLVAVVLLFGKNFKEKMGDVVNQLMNKISQALNMFN